MIDFLEYFSIIPKIFFQRAKCKFYFSSKIFTCRAKN